MKQILFLILMLGSWHQVGAQAWPTTQKERIELLKKERAQQRAAEKAEREREKKNADSAAKPRPTPKPEPVPAGVDVIEITTPDP